MVTVARTCRASRVLVNVRNSQAMLVWLRVRNLSIRLAGKENLPISSRANAHDYKDGLFFNRVVSWYLYAECQ
jgi:hypothetical protein